MLLYWGVSFCAWGCHLTVNMVSFNSTILTLLKKHKLDDTQLTPKLYFTVLFKNQFGYISGVAAQSSELLDLLSPAALKSADDKELITTDTTNDDSRSLIGSAKCVVDVVLAVPTQIVVFINRIVTAIYTVFIDRIVTTIYTFWVFIFSTFYRVYSAVFLSIGNTGYGIVNFCRELVGIIFSGFFSCHS